MRKKGVHAGECFERLRLINLVIQFAALLRNGEDAGAGHGLKRIGRRGTEHANAQIAIVAGIHQSRHADKPTKYSFENLRASHAASIADSRIGLAQRLCRYCLISTGVPSLCVEPKRL